MLTVLAFIDHTITVAVWTRFSFHGASSALFSRWNVHPDPQLLYQGQRRRSPLSPLASYGVGFAKLKLWGYPIAL
jgi:hypothetical protein